MDKTDFNIMFTCAGRRVALLQAFRAAMAEVGAKGKIIATDVTRASPAYHKADVGLILPLVAQDRYIPDLLEHVQRHRVKLLVPTTDRDLPALAQGREEFERVGCTVLIGSEQAIHLCRNKDRTNDFLAHIGLPSIKTMGLPEFLDQPFYPCFIKPVRGSAGVGSAVLQNEKELRDHVMNYGDRMIVQEYLSGQEYTVDVYRSRDGQVRSVVPRQRLVVRSGEVEIAVTVRDQELIDSTVRLAGEIDDLWGVFCCQCRRGQAGSPPRFFEINPRFGGGAPLSFAAGANMPLYLLQELLELPITAKLGQFTNGLMMLRYDEAMFLPAGDLESLPGFRSPQIR